MEDSRLLAIALDRGDHRETLQSFSDAPVLADRSTDEPKVLGPVRRLAR